MAVTRARKNAMAAAARRARKKPFKPNNNHHHMRTRAKSKAFNFNRLPAELRNQIYGLAYGSNEPTELMDLRLPKNIKVPGIFSEALPVFFETTAVDVSVRTTWCVRYKHVHGPRQKFFSDTGKIQAWPKVTSNVPEAVVRFRKVRFMLGCSCCESFKLLGSLDIHAQQNDFRVKKAVESRDLICVKVVEGLDKMLAHAEETVMAYKGTEGFNGFSMEDLKQVAMCFRVSSPQPQDQTVGC